MAKITLHGTPFTTCGELPALNSLAPHFTLTQKTLEPFSFTPGDGKRFVLNIFPSVDTPVCAASVRKFNEEAAALENVSVLCISMDLPFALGRFCGAEGLERVITLSAFRNPDFGQAYGVTIVDGPLAGLFARAVVVVGSDGKIMYSQLVPEIAQEPDYETALKSIKR